MIMKVVELDGVLYRGADPDRPTQVWNYAAKKWVTYHQGWVRGSGTEISDECAEVLKFDSPGAHHYMYYDTPPWSEPPNRAYWDQLMPPDLKAEIAASDRAKAARVGSKSD